MPQAYFIYWVSPLETGAMFVFFSTLPQLRKGECHHSPHLLGMPQVSKRKGGLPGLVATPSARAYLQVVRVLMMRKAPAAPAVVGQGRTQPMSNAYANWGGGGRGSIKRTVRRGRSPARSSKLLEKGGSVWWLLSLLGGCDLWGQLAVPQRAGWGGQTSTSSLLLGGKISFLLCLLALPFNCCTGSLPVPSRSLWSAKDERLRSLKCSLTCNSSSPKSFT